MAKGQISEKVQQATERYLSSLGASREQLTDRQWEITANYIKTERMKLVLLLVFGVLCACLVFFSFRVVGSRVADMLPEEMVFVSEGGDEYSMTLKNDMIYNHIDYLTYGCFLIGSLYIITCFIFLSVFVSNPLQRKADRKMLEAFILREKGQGTSSEE